MKLAKVASHWQAAKRVTGQGCVRVIFPARNGCVRNLLCPCKLKTYGMPSGGRKNRLGALHGPCGHEWLNGCAPAMLAGLCGANCDVQVPYRLPYSCPTCGDQLTAEERQQMSLAAQRAQDAQTGYCADYCSKGQPMGHGEIREFQKGHEQLHAQHAQKPLDDL